jgi:hypothetical protein
MGASKQIISLAPKVFVYIAITLFFIQLVFYYSQFVDRVNSVKEERPPQTIVSSELKHDQPVLNKQKKTAPETPQTVNNDSQTNQTSPITFTDPGQDLAYKIYKTNLIKSAKPDRLFKYAKHPRVSRPAKNNKFFSILEYTRTWGYYRFCDRQIDPEQLTDYTDDAFKTSYGSYKHRKDAYDLLESCVYKNCFFTCDQSAVNQTDAVLIYEQSINMELSVQVESQARERQAWQIWMLWNDEANVVNPVTDTFKFNWTITYNTATSAAAYCSYGCYTSLAEPFGEAAFDRFARSEFKKRRANAVWFVSNCQARSRLEYAARLSNSHAVDVFGGCGEEVKRLTGSGWYKSNYLKVRKEPCKHNSDCEISILTGNKFYLSFENQNCRYLFH